MKRVLVIIITAFLFLYATGAAQAATYYVAPGGNDTAAGTSQDTAWRSISKVNSARFVPGDSILFKRGSVWREKLSINSSGTSADPIVVGAYGNGNPPVITGADNFSAPSFRWQASARVNEWYLTGLDNGNPGITEPGGVWINDAYQYNGRYNGTAWQPYSAGSLVENSWQWADADGLGFNTIYIYQITDPNSSGAKIEASQRSNCVLIQNQQYITLRDLELRQSGKRTVTEPILYIYQSPYIAVKNCSIHDSSGQAGAVYVMRSHHFSLEGSQVYNSYDPDGNGYGTLIYFESGSSGQCSDFIIRNNVIYGSYARLADLVGAVGTWVNGTPYGSTGALIENNEFYGPAQNAVYFRSGARQNIIRNNYIHDIKGYQVNGGIGVQLRDNANNNAVYNNVVFNVYGPSMQSDGKNGGPGSTDPSCDGNKFFNNVIYNGNYPGANGFHFFGANRNLEARNNIVVSNSGDMLLAGNADDTAYQGITLSNNRYYKTTTVGQEFVYRGVNHETLESMQQAMVNDGYPNENGSSYGIPGFLSGHPKSKDDLSLAAGSPCIDSGVEASGFNYDIRGVLRPQGAGWDIGAYEYASSHAIYAASASYADVSAAVQQAGNGDTVLVPEGTVTWGASLTITKAITLQGSGVDKTKIINGGVTQLIRIQPASQNEASQKIRISGICFYYPITPVYSLGGERQFILVQGKQDGSYPITQLRIDHCKFEKGYQQIYVDGWVYGVIDHNEFLNGNMAIRPNGDGTLSWERPIEAGTPNALFIEDNTFTMNNEIGTITLNRNADSMIYQGAGARTVTRFNTFDATAFTPTNSALNPQFYDSHGNQRYYEPNYSVGHQRGQPILEIYNNKFYTYKATANLFQIRGGSTLIHDNDFKAVMMSKTSSVPYFYEEECSAIASFPILRTEWPAEDAHTNTFIWNNTCDWTGGVGNCDGTHITDAHVGGCSMTFIQKDRDYFMHEPQASGGKSIYTGRIGASNTYPTDGGSDTLIFNPSGPNAYYPYTPYTYPHPLTLTDVDSGDLSGDGVVTAYDAALALQLGRGELEAGQIGLQAVVL